MRRAIALAALLVLLADNPRAAACKFCCSPSPTLRQEAAQAQLILYGKLANPRQGRDGNGNPTPKDIEGTTDFFIEQAVKLDPALGGRTKLELRRLVAVDPKQPRYLIFFDVNKGQIDPYKGISATPAVVDYLQGMLAIDPKDQRRLLAYAFRHLEHPDAEIARDAFREFERAEYPEYRHLARTLLPDLLTRWLEDTQVPASRRAFYGLLLGHCGGDNDARLLRRLLDPQRQDIPNLDQLLIGYTLLRPKEGWAFTQGLLKDESVVFLHRYAALRALRFFWDTRTDVVPRKDLFAGICLLLEQGDIADLAIEDLRRWRQWDVAARVLGLEERKDFWGVPIIRRSVMRYALTCPLPAAAQFVQRVRKQDPELVQGVEEIIQLEKDSAATDS